jgi:PTH1 family peptidyl-tRNA hydrolase
MKLVVWLWNPWKEYEKTRHSIGFFLVDNIVEGGRWKVEGIKWKGEWQETVVENQKVIFLKPMEFMNRSWWAVSAVANFYKIEPKDILVIHDDIDLPVGKIQLKLWWSSAGHNWLKDIIAKLWVSDFYRLRIGIDRPVDQKEVADYVLSSFKKEEKNVIEDKMSEIETYIHHFIEM